MNFFLFIYLFFSRGLQTLFPITTFQHPKTSFFLSSRLPSHSNSPTTTHLPCSLASTETNPRAALNAAVPTDPAVFFISFHQPFSNVSLPQSFLLLVANYLKQRRKRSEPKNRFAVKQICKEQRKEIEKYI
jgi:hypothetical protein